MTLLSVLTIIGLGLASTHFIIPLTYYIYLRKKWLYKPWNVKRDCSYSPRVAIILPTYIAAKNIVSRLDNIYEQNYPRDLIEVIVVDDNSPDGTAERVKEWYEEHRDISLKLVVRPSRSGKLSAILEGIKHISSDNEIIVFTDDDCVWNRNALKNTISYFADPRVGVVTGSIKYLKYLVDGDNNGIHNVYRMFYNMIRVAESKLWSTPIHNGPLIAIRKSIVNKIGLPSFPEADDSAFGSYIAFAGYRAIQVDDVWVYEFSSSKQHERMLRRAQHLITFFLKLRKYAKQKGVYKETVFDKIWTIESYLHLLNPWILLIAILLLLTSLILGSTVAGILFLIGIVLLIFKPYRTWITMQIYLIIASLKKLWAKEITWPR